MASFPMIIYFWPTMVGFGLFGLLQAVTKVDPATLGLVATFFWALNLLVIVTDLDQKKFIIALLAVALLGLGAWITTLKKIGLITSVTTWLGGLEVYYSNHAFFVIFFLFWFFFALGMLHPRFNYWRLEPNEFVHYIQPFGRDISIPRMGHTVNKEIPDVLEFLLLRSGSIVLHMEHEDRAIVLDNVIGINKKEREVKQILESYAVRIRKD